MDVHDKLDELSALVENARAMPMSASCVVNRGAVLDLVDDVRQLLPDSLAQADGLLADREQVIAAARLEAAQVLEDARAEAAAMVAEHEIHRAAVAAADQVTTEAAEQAARMRRETDDYVDAKLANFEVALHKTLLAVQTGREKIRGRHAYEDLGELTDDAPLPG